MKHDGIIMDLMDTTVEVVAFVLFVRGSFGFINDAIAFGEWLWQ